MRIKTTALTVSIAATILYVAGQIWPNDPYFFLVSSNSAVAIPRLVLAALLIKLGFEGKFYYKFTHRLFLLLSLGLVGFGLAGLGVPSMDYALFNIIKPLDYIYFVGVGTLFGYAGLAYQRGKQPLPRLARPRLPQLRPSVSGRA